MQFWKKQEVGIEFVKHFRAHMAPVKHMTINSNGTLMITVSDDKHGKVFDVVNFDMINILAFDYKPEVAAWVHQPGDAIQVCRSVYYLFNKPRVYSWMNQLTWRLLCLDVKKLGNRNFSGRYLGT